MPTDPSTSEPSAIGPSATRPSATGPSTTGPSATGPSATGPSVIEARLRAGGPRRAPGTRHRNPGAPAGRTQEDGTGGAGELVVLSHLRWTFVWQRPQHLVSRLARTRRTWFVEEPLVADVSEPRLRTETHGPVTRVWLDVPGPERHVGFDDPVAAGYPAELARLLGPPEERTAWIYTPMALEMAFAVRPTVLVFDVMDDLASFRYASPELRLRHHRALREADVVFTGGRSLHRGVLEHRPQRTWLFPSGVEPEHWSVAAGRPPRQGGRPVAGYVGVIDERLDLDLVAGLAERLPDWDVHMVGPTLKIDDATLPTAPNLRYLGPQVYGRLPLLMSEFDVALMPFARNEATRSISPTKTLEYLAAGLPVVSTRVPDVVADYAAVVELADDVDGFTHACRRALGQCPLERADRVRPILQWQHWDAIASRMESLIAQVVEGDVPAARSSRTTEVTA